MSDLTEIQAIRAARELKEDFNSHSLMKTRRLVRAREIEPDLEALGITPRLKDIISWQTEEPNQEAHRYAAAFSTAEPEVSVFTEGDAPEVKKRGEELESFYNGSLLGLVEDSYPFEIHMAADGLAVGRLDLKPGFWRGIPSRDGMPADDFNIMVDEHRKNVGLPFDFPMIDPATFFYEEDKKREKVTLGAEFGLRKVSVLEKIYKESGQKKKSPEKYLSPTVPDDDTKSRGKRVLFVVLRTPETIYHIRLDDLGGSKSKGDDVLWEGPNLLKPSTGYILWRGRYSGFSDPERKYEPFIMASLNAAQPKSLFITLQMDFAVQAAQVWLEQDPSKGPPTIGRAITKAAKTAGATRRTEQGRAAASFEEGAHLRWREVAGDLKEALTRLEMEEERNSFSDALMGEAAASATGRAIIRMQEAAGKQLRQGLKAKQKAMLELVRTVRHTLFQNNSMFFSDNRSVFVPHLVEGLEPEGLSNRNQIIAIGKKHNIPHTISVKVIARSEAAQLALHEEGIKLEGILSRDTLDQDFHNVRNVPLENRRRVKDAIRRDLVPGIVKRATADAMAIVEMRGPPRQEIVIPGEETGTEETVSRQGQGGGGQPPGVSGAATPPRTEDVGLQGGGGYEPR